MSCTAHVYTWEQALNLLADGLRITRPSLGQRFLFMDGDMLRCGAHNGETGLGTSQIYTPTEDDKRATDWIEYKRILPDSWDGCDIGDGVHQSEVCYG